MQGATEWSIQCTTKELSNSKQSILWTAHHRIHTQMCSQKIFAKSLKKENHIWKRNINVFVRQVADNCWYLENQLLQEVKMQIFQMNVEHCTLHGRQKLSQNLLDVFQVDSFRTYVSKGCQIRSNYSQDTFSVNSLHWVWTFSNVWLVLWWSNNNVLWEAPFRNVLVL